MAQHIKDPALLQLQPTSQLQLVFDPRPGKSRMPWVQPKKKKNYVRTQLSLGEISPLHLPDQQGCFMNLTTGCSSQWC